MQSYLERLDSWSSHVFGNLVWIPRMIAVGAMIYRRISKTALGGAAAASTESIAHRNAAIVVAMGVKCATDLLTWID
jgi:hypothetical protein